MSEPEITFEGNDMVVNFGAVIMCGDCGRMRHEEEFRCTCQGEED